MGRFTIIVVRVAVAQVQGDLFSGTKPFNHGNTCFQEKLQHSVTAADRLGRAPLPGAVVAAETIVRIEIKILLAVFGAQRQVRAVHGQE